MNRKTPAEEAWDAFNNPQSINDDDPFRLFSYPHITNDNRLDFSSFEFSNSFRDSTFIDENATNGFELFKYYYCHVVDSSMLRIATKEFKKFFERNYVTKHGCSLNRSFKKNPACAIRSMAEMPQIDFTRLDPRNLTTLSNSIELVNGKYVASSPISECKTLMVETPIVFYLPVSCSCSEIYYYQCFHCRKPLDTYLACSTCGLALYCSEGCKVASAVFHKWECRAMKTHFFGRVDISVLPFRMLMIAVYHKFNLKGFGEIISIPCNIKLFAHNQKKRILRKSLQILEYLKQDKSFFIWLHNHQIKVLEGKTPAEIYLYIGGLLVHFFCQVFTNVMYFPEEEFTVLYQTRGVNFSVPAICRQALHLQHNCNPNAKLMFRSDKLIVRALRHIEENETITVNIYLRDEFEVHNKKKIFLLDRKRRCTCEICLAPHNLNYGEVMYVCTSCKGRAGKVNNVWICFDCGINLCSMTMEYRRDWTDAKMMSITRMKFENLKTMFELLAMYPNYFHKISLEYFVVVAQAVRYMLQHGHLVTCLTFVMSLMDMLKHRYDPYSFVKLYIITKVFNCLLIHCFKNRADFEETILIAMACYNEMSRVGRFHCLTYNLEAISILFTKICEHTKILNICELPVVNNRQMYQNRILMVLKKRKDAELYEKLIKLWHYH